MAVTTADFWIAPDIFGEAAEVLELPFTDANVELRLQLLACGRLAEGAIVHLERRESGPILDWQVIHVSDIGIVTRDVVAVLSNLAGKDTQFIPMAIDGVLSDRKVVNVLRGAKEYVDQIAEIAKDSPSLRPSGGFVGRGAMWRKSTGTTLVNSEIKNAFEERRFTGVRFVPCPE